MNTIIIAGAGPRIRIRVPQGTGSKVAVITRDRVKTIELNTTANVRFAA